jgi:deoxyribonuclease-4
MIRLGPAGRPISFEGKYVDCTPFLKKLNLSASEVQFVRRIWMRESIAREFGERARKDGISLSVHAPYFVNLCSSKKEVIRLSKQRIIESARLASLMNASHVVFHPGYYGKLSQGEAYRVVRDALKEIIDRLGKNKVAIAPETMGNPTKFGTMDELISLCKEIKGLTLTLDFAHLHARYNGLFKSKKEYIKLLQKIEVELGKRYLENLHTHFTCVAYDPQKGEKHHLPLEEKEPDFELFARALKDYSLDSITIISESPILEQDSLVMRDILKRIGLLKT